MSVIYVVPQAQKRERNILHEHLGPVMLFSLEALLHVQCPALSFPQEHLACAAQTQPPSLEMLQQVEG